MISTAHFSARELSCHHCGQCHLDAAFLAELEALRVEFGRPMELSSGYRCPEYNDTVSHTGRHGPHTIAAVDVRIAGADAYDLISVAMSRRWRGIGVKQKGPWGDRFIHLDNLPNGERSPRPRVWSY
ncbi:MAG: D-Ala-D-Ala carboxypeptidase family metallohydrolase [Dehalococcoidia bacterium]